ncbi:SDR family oxidoreductase [Streptomyces sp. NPDC058464]|uniref:SDR family oxidoreductase n=1 Tax=Streptomyces sp. NPDC058464 TaxID=3346511 RepID=UPI00365E7CB6
MTHNSCAAHGGCHRAARGIGAAAARRPADDGLAVGVIDPDETDCGDTVEAITGVGGAAPAIAADVADEAAVTAAVARIAAAFGPPTVLVDNAGIRPRTGLVDMTTQQWDTVSRGSSPARSATSRAGRWTEG